MNKRPGLDSTNHKADGSTIRTGKLVVNLDTRAVSVDDQPVRLTGKEYGVLELLSLSKGTTLTKEMFLNHLYGGPHEPETKIIDVFVCKLRKKNSTGDGRNSLHRDGLGSRLCPSGPSHHYPADDHNRYGHGQFRCALIRHLGS